MTTKVFVSYAYQDKELAENAKHELAAKGHLPADTVFLTCRTFQMGRVFVRNSGRKSGKRMQLSL